MDNTTTTRVALKWGLIAALISIVLGTAINLSGLWKVKGINFLLFGIIGVIIFLAQKDYKSGNNGFMSYGQGLGIGTLMGAISGLIGALYNVIYFKFIDPTFLDQMKVYQEDQMIEQGMSEQQIDMAMEISSKFSSPGALFLFSVLGSLIICFLLSLVISAFNVKKEPVF